MRVKANKRGVRRPVGRPPGSLDRTGKALRTVPYAEADWILAAAMGEKIRAVRDEQGLALAELAAAIGIHLSNIARYESGEMLAPTRRLYQMAQAMGVRMIDLIPEGY